MNEVVESASVPGATCVVGGRWPSGIDVQSRRESPDCQVYRPS
jgi:hypothetical protein